MPSVDLTHLSAYLDGELDGDCRMAVEHYLKEHPEMAVRLGEYRRRDAALRLAFGKLSAPRTRLIQPRMPYSPAIARRRTWGVAAAVVLWIALTGGGWWLYNDSQAVNRELAALMHDATAAHLLYSSRTDSGVGFPDNQQHSSQMLEKLFGGDVKPPDLSSLGFHLVGVTELTRNQRPAALLTYRHDSGQFVSCYFQRSADKHGTGFRQSEQAGLNISYRLGEGVSYAVVGALQPELLQRIAEATDAATSGDSDDEPKPTLPSKLFR